MLSLPIVTDRQDRDKYDVRKPAQTRALVGSSISILTRVKLIDVRKSFTNKVYYV